MNWMNDKIKVVFQIKKSVTGFRRDKWLTKKVIRSVRFSNLLFYRLNRTTFLFLGNFTNVIYKRNFIYVRICQRHYRTLQLGLWHGKKLLKRFHVELRIGSCTELCFTRRIRINFVVCIKDTCALVWNRSSLKTEPIF